MQRAFLLAVLLALLSLLLFVQVHGNRAWLRVALDGSHVPIFASAAVLMALMLRGGESPGRDGRRYLLAFTLAFATGVLIEYVQSFAGRPASLFDMGSNAAGAAIGLALLALREGALQRLRLGRAGRWMLAGAAVVGLLYASLRPLEATRAYLNRASRFPVLAAFNGPADLYFVDVQGLAADIVTLPERWVRRPGERALRIRYDATRAPAIQISEPAGDWRGHRTVALDMTNAGDVDLQFVLRILDADHDWSHEDRFNQPFTLPAATRITLQFPIDAIHAAPAGREMDLSHIANVMVFGREIPVSGEVYLSGLWLQ